MERNDYRLARRAERSALQFEEQFPSLPGICSFHNNDYKHGILYSRCLICAEHFFGLLFDFKDGGSTFPSGGGVRGGVVG
jgi:hypothetical protein